MSTTPTTIASRLRPRSIGEIIDAAFRLYRRNFLTFLVIVAVVYLPVRLLFLAFNAFVLGSYGGSSSAGGSLSASGLGSSISEITTYLEDYLTYFAQWALAIAVANVISGYVASFSESYRDVLQRLRSVLGLMGLQILLLLGIMLVPVLALYVVLGYDLSGASAQLSTLGSFLYLVYAIVLVWLQVVVPACAIEGISPREAFGRSRELTRNYWWRTLGLDLLVSILSLVVLIPGLLVSPILSSIFRFDAHASSLIQQVFILLGTVVFAPIEIGSITLYYFDLRVRKEGFDLERAIAGRYEADDYSYAGENSPYGSRLPAPPSAPVYGRAAHTGPGHSGARRKMRRVAVSQVKHKHDRIVTLPPEEAEQ